MIETPVRLNTDVDDRAYCALWDVYLNGVKQSDCLIADSQHGYVRRFRRVFGVLAKQRGRVLTEDKRGVVTIVPKGQPLGI